MSFPDWQGCLERWAGSAARPAQVTRCRQGINAVFGSVPPLAGQCSWAGMEVGQYFISGKDHKQTERLREQGGCKEGIMTQRSVCESQCFPGLPRSYTQPPTWKNLRYALVQQQSKYWELEFRSLGLQRVTSSWCLCFHVLSTWVGGIWNNSDEVVRKYEITILLYSCHCVHYESCSEKTTTTVCITIEI